jgi:Caspase domain
MNADGGSFSAKFWRLLLAASLIVIFVMLAPAAGFAQTRRAVLAGINTYVPAGTTAKKIVLTEKAGVGGRGSWTNLEGSLNDVESIRQLLITRYGFEEKNIHVLTEAEATHANILDAIQKYLADPAAPGDISFFYYAGHGSQMHNSLSPEEDKQDETTVPSDSYKGTMDIRDKEYARSFMKVIEKGALLTAVFDSCHSGSIARGYSRFDRIRALPPDPRDASDDYAGPFPEKRGALIFAAAQDIESAAEGRDENGNEHGAFTAALMKVLSSAPIDESANDIFLQTFATMRSAGASQVPVISGPADRIRGPLFGASSGNLSGKITLPVITADEDGTVQLLGGFSLGFGIGTELVPAQKPAAGSAAVRLKITAQTPGKSTAKTLAGDAAKFAPGMLFVVDRWAPSGKGLLALWVPPADLSVEELKRVADGVNKLRGVAGITVVDDPYETTPTHIISWNGTAWVLTNQNTQATKPLGRTPDLMAVAKGLPSGKTKIFVNLPLPKEAGAGVAALTGGPSPVRAVTSIREANYLLVGRATPNGIDYAWLLPGASKDSPAAAAKKSGAESAALAAPPDSSLPPETRWVPAQSGSKTFETAIVELTELAGNLSRINGWLALPSPADDGGFPYHLVLYESKNPDATTPVTTTIGDGRSYGLALRADPSELKHFVGPRRVYIFVIDSDGNGVPVFPNLDMGDVENVHPTPAETHDGIPTEIKLGPVDLFTVSKPFGTDTYFMLTTAPQDAINLASLNWEGVRGAQRGAESPLDQLLSSVGTRSPRPVTPASWSITKLAIHSQPEP